MKNYINILSSLLFLISMLAACSNQASTKVENASKGQKAEVSVKAKAKEKEKENHVLKIGDTATIKDITVKLNQVRVIKEDFFDANNGHFIGVSLEITNNSNNPVVIEPLLQTVLKVNGEKQDIALINTLGSLDNKIEPNATISGEVAFDSKIFEQYEFIFKNSNSKNQAIWVFNEKDLKEEE